MYSNVSSLFNDANIPMAVVFPLEYVVVPQEAKYIDSWPNTHYGLGWLEQI